VLREVRYKEADRLLTVLTDTEGKLTVKARGALRKSSRTAAATQQLTFAEMTLFGNRGRWTVNEAVVKEGFDGLRGDLERFALGAYFAECIEALSVEEQPEPELLQLGLNCLYALSRGLYAPEKIKAAFETRLMCVSGYAPELGLCPVCGKEPVDPMLSLDHGCVCCRACAGMGERAALGAFLGLEAEAVLPTAGGVSALDLAMGVGASGVLLADPCFSEYEELAKRHGLPVRRASLLKFPAIKRAVGNSFASNLATRDLWSLFWAVRNGVAVRELALPAGER
jgi:DNA repair protein RecO (recombination protein O)